MSGMNCCDHEENNGELHFVLLEQEIVNLRNDIAILELESVLMRARNERLQAENEVLMRKLAGPCSSHAFEEGDK
jgi:hypothetical protein